MSFHSDKKALKRSKISRKLGQGIKIFHESKEAEVDIIAIPGLGTNPTECWTWTEHSAENGHSSEGPANGIKGRAKSTDQRRQFNWIRDPDGLATLFPKSRIMLYDYASAWTGSHKVRATMKSICAWLLDDLKAKRKSALEIVRPLIFIGHSMGGIVIGKSLCMAKTKPEFEAIATCTMGCVFFGTPFRGTNMAKIALLYSSVFGNEAYEALVAFMRKENNDTLNEVTDEFVNLCTKVNPPIELFCAYETIEMDTSYSDRLQKVLPSLLQHDFFTSGARKLFNAGLTTFGAGTHFVEMEDALLPGVEGRGLTADHRDMIKFESVEADKFLVIRVALEKMVKAATSNVTRRTTFLGQKLWTQKFVNQVRHFLEGVDMRTKLTARVKQGPVTSWLSAEPALQQWLSTGPATTTPVSYLWLKGGPGLGKTTACIAAIQQLHKTQQDAQQNELRVTQNESFLAYFLCEETAGCCTAEDVLKSLITQLINQDESLAQHARWFAPNPRYRSSINHHGPSNHDSGDLSSTKATATVDNLWKCLQDMLDDPVIVNIHIVISNIHCLESTASTTALLSKLRESALTLGREPLKLRSIKWLLSSRNHRDLHDVLTTEYIAVIDLENDAQYGAKVMDARRTHARAAIMHLASTKHYSYDLTFYVRNSIESQSEDEKWIDLVCILLAALPDNSSYLTVRRWLNDVGGVKMHSLIDSAWDQLLQQNEDIRLELEEILQLLAVTLERPTLADLAVISKIDNHARLAEIISRAGPILKIQDRGEYQGRISFANAEIEDRLKTVCHGSAHVGDRQKRRYHGLIALRCFDYLKSAYTVADQQGLPLETVQSLVQSTSSATQVVGDPAQAALVNEDDELNEPNDTTPQVLPGVCQYPIKHLFHHLRESTPDVVHVLHEDDPDFWGLESAFRAAWLRDFQSLTLDLKDLDVDGMSALHVAAGLDASEIASVLLHTRHEGSSDPLSWTTDNGLTPLHVAAFNNHYHVVDMLIREGADIEAGNGGAGTALLWAALQGNCTIMQLLIEKKANVNAFCQEGPNKGPVINAAIRSGNVEAVKQIMEGDVRFDFDYTRFDPPLSLSARYLEPSIFQGILENGKTKWLQHVSLVDDALIEAARSGRLESVRILLKFPHVYINDTIETAILSAAEERKWAIVHDLLDFAIRDMSREGRKIKLDPVFFLASTTREDRLDILQKIWTFTHRSISEVVIDFSLYQATTLKKDTTAIWLLDTCRASPNTTTEQASLINGLNSHAVITTDFYNPLNAAASMGNLVLVQALLRHDVKTDGKHAYALHLAAREGHNDVVEALLQHESTLVNTMVSDSDELNFHSGTALQAACENNKVDVVSTLLAHGADPNLGGGTFTNPLTAATRKDELEILKLLLQAPKIKVDTTGGEDNSTPLINAAMHMSTEAIDLLVQSNANIDAKNSAGDTALIMAAARGENDSVELLCRKGADVTYRSPGRGLPIQVAASGANPLCAYVLAEKMGGTIEVYREKVDVDIPRRLEEGRATLHERDRLIETLESRIKEKEEQLEDANNEIEQHKLSQTSIESEYSMRGQTYYSMTEQIKAAHLEREELRKQLETEKGQSKLVNDMNKKIQARLTEEKQKNTDLRNKFGYVALQEDLAKAQADLVSSTQASQQQSHRDETMIDELQREIEKLQDGILEMSKEVKAAREATSMEHKYALATRQEYDELQGQHQTLEATIADLESTLEKIRLAAKATEEANAATNGQVNGRTPGDRKPVIRNGSYGFSELATAGSSSPVGNAHFNGHNGAAVASPPGSPDPAATTPGGTARRPNEDIRGIHRASGAYGGYKRNRTGNEPRKSHSDSLYSNSS